jgi:phage-related minor tail protein
MEGLGLGIQEGTQVPVGAMQDVAGTLEGPVQSALSSLQSTAKSAFTGFVTGATSAREAVGQLLQSLAKMWADAAFQNLLGGAFGDGGFLSFLVPSFDGGGYTGNMARSGGLDGKGGFMAMLHPNETVIDHSKGQSAGGGQTVIKLDLSPDLEARIMEQSGAQSVQLIQGFNNQVLPQRLQQISRDPRKRGR